MDHIWTAWIIPAGAIVAALIAGLFSFFNLILSKEEKLSQFRQDWIDGLRDDIANYAAGLNAVYALTHSNKAAEGGELKFADFAKASLDPHTKTSTAFTSILLRLDPDDKSTVTQSLIAELDKSRDLFMASDFEGASNCLPEIRRRARVVLKEEWTRVRKGEKTFRWSKRIALVVLVATVMLGGYLVLRSQTEQVSHVANGATGVPAHAESGPADNGSAPR